MEFTKTFEELSKKDVGIAGGKGASLGEMTSAFAKATADKQASYNPVPPGFVVLAEAFEEFLRETDLSVELDAILDHVRDPVPKGPANAQEHSISNVAGQAGHADIHLVNSASEKIQALILGASLPEAIQKEVEEAFGKLDAKYVAVRSSATSEDSADAAWAGQLDSFLNTTEETLLENVKKCWASLFTPRAIFYRFETQPSHKATAGKRDMHHDKISVAVVVQKMIQSEVAGIAFSVHPVTQDRDQMIIEAGFGLGEAIVSGSITPDSYVVKKSVKKILDKNITVQEKGIFRATTPSQSPPHMRGRQSGGEVNAWKSIPADEGAKPTLTDEEVLDLSELVMKIEAHYGFPVDVEWALLRQACLAGRQGSGGQAREGGKFYIVQSRPITTL